MTWDICDLRAYQSDDAAVVRTIHDTAFDGPQAGRIVEALHAGRGWISEVALMRGAVVGHVLFSQVSVEAADQRIWPAWALAPLAVLPFYQRRGIGQRLVKRGLKRCTQAHPDLVFVLGDPAYYARFGFRLAEPLAVLPPDPSWVPAFQVLELREGALEGVRGTVRYPPCFDDA